MALARSHGPQPHAGAFGLLGIEPDPVIGDGQDDVVAFPIDVDGQRLGLAVMKHIGDGFLGDAEQGDLHVA